MNSDVLTAQKECLKTIDQWEGLIKRLKTVVHEQDTYAPDAFAASVDGLMPEIIRRGKGFISWAQILVQLKTDHDGERRTSHTTTDVDTGREADNADDVR